MGTRELVQAMKYNRFDLADYLIHFTKQSEKSSFATLKEIITSGKIICDWSIRNDKRNVFGNFPAVCFTDMPLFSFYQYVQNRHDETKVDFYGIAINKASMFKLGARNVIYGTTNNHEEQSEPDNEGKRITSFLNEKEQYRFIRTEIDDKHDWTHEREWRWTNQFGQSTGDYLPIWKIDQDYYGFGDTTFAQEREINIITRLNSEIDELVSLFETFQDPKIYNLHNIQKTYAISLQNIEASNCLSYDKLTFISLYNEGLLRKVVIDN
jgi:hypothetical protein